MTVCLKSKLSLCLNSSIHAFEHEGVCLCAYYCVRILVCVCFCGRVYVYVCVPGNLSLLMLCLRSLRQNATLDHLVGNAQVLVHARTELLVIPSAEHAPVSQAGVRPIVVNVSTSRRCLCCFNKYLQCAAEV